MKVLQEVARNVSHLTARNLARLITGFPGKPASRFLKRAYSYSVERRFDRIGANARFGYQTVTLGEQHITIGANFIAQARLCMEAYAKHGAYDFQPFMTIGDNVSLGFDCHLACIHRVTIGSNVLIGSRVHITDHSHGNTDAKNLAESPNKRRLVSKGPVVIEDNVWLGEGVVVLPGVVIGRNAVIGANAVVTRNIPAYCVAVGVPAVVVKRSDS